MDAMDVLARIGDPGTIPPLLRLAERFTPLERRRAEATILRWGVQSVPVLVALLRDRTCAFPGRGVVARALGRLALPQLELLSDTLIRDEIEHAYQGSGDGRCSGAPRPRQGWNAQAVHTSMCGAMWSTSCSGPRGRWTAPNVELLSASLGSENRKERGDAIETIEQGVTREVFRALLPLVDRRAPMAQTAWCEQYYAPQVLTPMQVLDAALSGTSLERLIAAQALCDAGLEGTRLLRARLDTLDPAVAAEVLDAMTRDADVDATLTHVEKMFYLRRSSFFARLGVQEAHVVASSTVARRVPAGDQVFARGGFVDATFCVLDGTVDRVTGR
jgi:hypothetical protein